MTTLSFIRNYTQIVQGVQICIDQKLLLPSLILIYTLIDSLAWASSNKDGSVRERFELWATKWLVPRLPCSATELYAARCAILHTLTSKSALTVKKDVREIAYAWGVAKSEDLQTVIDHLGQKGVVAVHVDALFQAVRLGLADMLNNAETDYELAACLADAAALHLTSQGTEQVNQYLTLIGDGLAPEVKQIQT